MITKGQKFGRYIVLSLWSISIAVLAAIYARQTGTNPYQSRYQSQELYPSAIENQNNGFTYYHYDPNTNRLRFMAGASSLRAENATLGIFRTAAARSVKIKDLQLIFCDYPVVTALESLQAIVLTEAADTDKNGLENIFGRFANNRLKWSVDIDLSNTREAAIDNFNCRVFEGNDLELGIQSRRAILDSDWPKVTLRGHVTVTCGDGASLVGNHIKWDTKKQTFTVDGMYVLRRGESQITGENICVDSHLNIAEAKNARK